MPMRAGPKGQVSAPPLNLRRLPLRLEQHWDLLPGLAAELAEDRGRIQWLRRGRLLLVVDLQVRLFVPDGIDVGRGRVARLLPPATSDHPRTTCLRGHPGARLAGQPAAGGPPGGGMADAVAAPASWPPSGVAAWTCYVELARWSSRQPRWTTSWCGV